MCLNLDVYRFQKSALGNCSWGMANLARAYRDGKGVGTDAVKALEWFNKVSNSFNYDNNVGNGMDGMIKTDMMVNEY